MADPLGLTLWAESASSADRGVDIVAVHGLRGFACWKHSTNEPSARDGRQPTFWLRDWLPADLPSARIFTYGYHLSTFRHDSSTIKAADELLDELKVLRAEKAEDMCHFTSDDDPSYLKILESLQNIMLGSVYKDQITVHSTFSPAEYEVLQSLVVEDMSTGIDDASQGTCNWILEHEDFKSWLQDKPSQILWVSGNPGSGKSTLMKHIIKHEAPESSVNSTLVAQFFFSQHGEIQSMGSLLRSLLYQILQSTSSSWTFEVFATLIEKRETLGSDRPWDDDLLAENLLRLIDKSTALGDSFSFYIDALDECNEPDRVIALVRRLNSLSPPRGIRTCLSSRHSPSFTPAREICMEDNNLDDIQRYLYEKLVFWKYSFPSALDLQSLIPAITNKAGGTFLWAALVVSTLLHDSSLEHLKSSPDPISWFPTNLDAAYERVLQRLWNSHGARRRRTAQGALTLVLCAIRPLSILELWNALEMIDDELDHQWTDWEQGQKVKLKEMPQEIETIPLDTTAQLMALCGGLLEVSSHPLKSSSGTISVSGLTVRFIHGTVREFLMGEGSPMIEEAYHERDRMADSHFRVARICLNHINGTATSWRFSVPSTKGSSSHFLGYAVAYGMQHLSLAAQLGVKPKPEDVFQSPPDRHGFIDDWVNYHNHYFANQNLFKPRKSKAAHVMSYFGIPWLGTGLWGASLADIKEQDHRGHTPLSFAAAMGHAVLCQTLIEYGADVNHRDHVYGQTPLILAASQGHRDVVEILLCRGSDSNDYISGVSPLWMAAGKGHLEVVQLLLETGASPGITNVHTGETVLSKATALGHIPIVNLLLEHGATVEKWDNHGWTPLHHAVRWSRKKTLELILGTLRQEQVNALMIALARVKSSWVNTVLRAIFLSLCFRQCGQSPPPPSEGSWNSKTPVVPGQDKKSTKPNRKRSRRKLNSESDEDDCDEEGGGGSEKRTRYSNPKGRRFACPYHRKNAMRYHDKSCNGIGFENIHRLKAHLKKIHSRVVDLQRCHICQTRFPHGKIVGHGPCVKREQPTDYEDGYDAVQLEKLTSKEMFPGRSSEEKCWYAIYRVLFPDWPKTKEIPSPYQEQQSRTVLPLKSFQELRETLTSADTIREIMNSSGSGQDERGLREFLEQLLGDWARGLGLYSTTESQDLCRGPEANSLTVPSLIPSTQLGSGIAPNAHSTATPPQLAPALLNAGGAHVQTASMELGAFQDSHQYLPIPEQSLFSRGNIHSYDGSLEVHSSAVASSDADSSFLQPTYDGSDMFTNNTPFSGSEPVAYRDQEWGAVNRSGNLSSLPQQMTASVPRLPTYVHTNNDPGHNPEAMFPSRYQDATSSYAGSGVLDGSGQQQWPTPMVFRQNDIPQFAESIPGGDRGKQDYTTDPYRPDKFGHGPASQA
ncbi:hypothetical protein AK830_g1632 [Neonectria ditissima]|uniref:Uncharacterized protein n=1 Tax=Neonectria ditissima TaxID=78410 RepID=A0A0P7BTW2_9HYPO|nr:hypothetical protein AK830_g1632 [Neonectria ditissima]